MNLLRACVRVYVPEVACMDACVRTCTYVHGRANDRVHVCTRARTRACACSTHTTRVPRSTSWIDAISWSADARASYANFPALKDGGA